MRVASANANVHWCYYVSSEQIDMNSVEPRNARSLRVHDGVNSQVRGEERAKGAMKKI